MTLEELTDLLSDKQEECDLFCQKLQKDYLSEKLKSGDCFTIGDVIAHSRLGHKIEIQKVRYVISETAYEFLKRVDCQDWEPSIEYNGKLLNDNLSTSIYGSASPLYIPHRRAVLVKKGAYNGPVFISK